MSFLRRYLSRKRVLVAIALWLGVLLSSVIFLHLRLSDIPLTVAAQELKGQAKILQQVSVALMGRGSYSVTEGEIGRIAEELDTRLTLIDTKGTVIADSGKDPRILDNHLDRPEIKAARNNGIGFSNRISESLGVNFLYLALPVLREGKVVAFARASIPVDRVDALRRELNLSLLCGFLPLTALSVALFLFFVRDLRRALDEVSNDVSNLTKGEGPQRAPLHQPLAQALDELRRSIETLRAKASRDTEKAERVRRTRELFLSKASHDLRGPINGILGMVELLSSTSLPEKQRRFVNLALKSARSLSSALTMVFDVAQLNLTSLSLEKEEIDPHLVTREALIGFLRGHSRRIEILLSVAEPLSTVYGDAPRIGALLTSLTRTIISAAGADELKVTCSQDRESVTWSFAFDTGVGGREAVGRVIQSFQGECEIASEIATLELYYLRHLLPELKGRLSTNEMGKAVSVHLVLPLDLVTRRDKPLIEEIAVISDSPLRRAMLVEQFERCGCVITDHASLAVVDAVSSKGSLPAHSSYLFLREEEDEENSVKAFPLLDCFHVVLKAEELIDSKDLKVTGESAKRALVVEDNEVSRCVLAAALEEVEVDFDCAQDGEQAVAALQRARYDIVFLDSRLPGISGEEVARLIRKGATELTDRSTERDVPIVAITASEDPEVRDACFAAGMSTWLGKTVGKERLLQILNGEEERPSSPYVDLELFLKRCLDKKEIMLKVASEFEQQLNRDIPRLHSLFSEGQLSDAMGVCHSLKGAASMVAAQRLAPLLARLEQAAKGAEREEMTKILQMLPSEIDGWKQEVRQKISRL